MEIIHHIFGTCGDNHPSLLHGLGAVGVGILYAYNYCVAIKIYIINLFKKKLK